MCIIPTWLLKENIEVLAPVITSIVNISLSSGEVPLELKYALVLPLLKKALLDPEIFKNFRPVSNLPFVSKVAEKVVDKRLREHSDENGLAEVFQSAYACHHSTETALVRVQNDILCAVDEGQACMLVLLDLSAAFDTIDHTILIERLSTEQGITGTALKWLQSYLSNRKQAVWIDGTTSEAKSLQFGVPQGSVLGPKLYVRYVKPTGDIIRKHGLQFHMYADDTQLYIFFTADKTTEEIEKLERCVQDIRSWMKDNLLKLNEDKTEVVLIGTQHKLAQVGHVTVSIGNSDISPNTSARNIGVVFDSKMTMEDHVSSIVRSANYHIRSIGKIRKYLTQDATEKLIHAFVTSKLDYANAVLIGVTKHQLNRLQRVLNTAARVVMRVRKYDHITPALKDLHWLPVQQRIQFKVLLLVFKCLNGLAPSYLSSLLKYYTPTRHLRSAAKKNLVEPSLGLKTFGDRAFSKIAPRLWNALPSDIKSIESVTSFKSALKGHLFKMAYGDC